jgi:hypothetical protein
MEASQQSQTKISNTDTQTADANFGEYSGEMEAPIDGGDLLLRQGQEAYTPKQVLQLQRVIGNQATLQLMRKAKAKQPINFSGLKIVQRDPKSGGLPPPPAPPLFSESTGLTPTEPLTTGLPTPESTMKKNMGEPDPAKFAVAVLRDYTLVLQTDPTDATYTQYWQENEIDQLATGWLEMLPEQQEQFQYLMTQLIQQSPELEIAVTAKSFEQSDETVGKGLEVVEAGINVSALTSSGFTTADGVELAGQLKDGIETVKTVGGVFEASFGSILSIAWLPLMIGYEAVRAFKYHKKRRDGYKTAMDSHKDATDEDGIKLHDIAKYAYKKTSRAFRYSIAKIALKIVRMIALIITLLTGGTSAVVTASIAAIAAAVETLGSLYRKIKGFIKKIRGTRGANRNKNAEELVKLAKGGNEAAAQTIIDVDPFDATTMKAMRAITNKLGAKLVGTGVNPVTNSRNLLAGLEKPKAPSELILLLQTRAQNGGWTAEHETMLVRALANTMASQ